MDQIFINIFSDLGLTDFYANLCGLTLLVISILIVFFLLNLISRKVLLTILGRIAEKTPTTWDDVLIEQGVFTRLSHIIPALILYSTLPVFFQKTAGSMDLIQRLLMAYMILIIVMVLSAFISSINIIYSSYKISRQRPIKGYLQIIRVMLAIMGIILIIATILDKSALGLLSGIGALSAVLMLVFKDSILGLVASIQLSGNDMVRIGDWVSIPEKGADGDVVDINLHTITIQNFDKTLVSVPIYTLISSSFKNWRGMSESGGRRIKRHINIDMNSVQFCSDELLKRLSDVELMKDHIQRKKDEIDQDNQKRNVDTSLPINGRRMTNLGCFRAYLAAYLKAHPLISDSMTFLVRQLQPTDKGIPLEIYVFSNDQAWDRYENIQADIFDHILATVSYFDLAVYQTPSSLDYRECFTKEKF